MEKRLSPAAPLSFVLLALLIAGPHAKAQAQTQVAMNSGSGGRGATRPARVGPPRRLVPVRASSTADGARVTVASDAPLDDYAAVRDGEYFFLRIPHAEASPAQGALEGRGFTDARVERRGDDVVLSFRLAPGTAARAVQRFNRLDLFFSATQQTPPAQTATTGTPQSPAPQGSATPVPSPTTSPAPANEAPVRPPTSVTNPATSPAAATQPTATESATEAAKAVAGTPTNSRNARLAALLTPEKRNPVQMKRFDKPPTIDGKLDEDVWKQAAVFRDFIQNRPGDLLPPSKQTEVLMGYDSRHLYIAFRAFDEPDKVRSTVAKRDAVFDDDWVGVVLDTFNDRRRAYELFFNPLGVQADAILTEGVNEDLSVDIVMESKGSLTPEGYVVEVAVPFKSLRYVAGKDKFWGIHLIRAIKRFNDERSSWMPLSRDISGYLIQAGRINGLEGLSNERTLEVIPSIALSQTGRRINRPVPGAPPSAALSPDGRFLNKPIEFDPGVSVKFGITPQMTLDFTYNPDFAQVEADATVVTANQRFPIFFEEKRPFFLEGKEIFETLISAVHTRTIVDPDYAAKLTGKQGRNTFGLLVASDDNPGFLSDDELTFLGETENRFDLSPDDQSRRDSLLKIFERNATVGILRLKRDVGKENHVGFLGTTYNFVDRYNHVGGFDTRFRLNKTTTFIAQVMGSVTHQPFFYAEEGGTFDRRETGMVYGAFLNMNGRNWGYELGSVGRSRFFRAHLGFNRRFNTHNPTAFFRYQSNDKPKAFLVRWRVYNFTGLNFDWTGRGQRFVNESQLQMNFHRQSYVGIGYERGFERVYEDEFGTSRDAPCATAADPDARCGSAFFGRPERRADRNSVYLFGGTVPNKQWSASFFTAMNWGVFDFDFGSGSPRYPRVSPAALALGQGAPLDPGAGDEWFFESSLTYKPTDPLNLSLFYTKDRLRRHDTDRLAFDDNIFSLRGTYQFTRFWFARA
ncbi:MAG TPA: DUF5916 domain-containing protein, partial [Pyrinomonadaceae bacterium]|nr:DUF5916 domain-containing protein [Pyrinomonadaceae bacterium]